MNQLQLFCLKVVGWLQSVISEERIFGFAVMAPRVAVVGGVVLDLVAKPAAADAPLRTSNPGTLVTGCGGVGQTIARALGKFGVDVEFHSVIGDDLVGRQVMAALPAALAAHVSPWLFN